MAGYSTYKPLDNVQVQSPNTKVLSDTDYYSKAVSQYNPGYSMKVNGLQNVLRNNLSNLENTKGTIDANYDKSAANQNLQNRIAKNNVNNDALNRGLGRSSIVTSGLASADLANNRAIAALQAEKTGALNNIALQQANASADEQNTENTLAANRLDEVQTLADRLKNADLDRNFNELNANRSFYMQQLGYNNTVNQMNDTNYWKNQDQNNWQQSFDNNNYWKGVEQNNWNKQFDLSKTNADRSYGLEKQQLDNSQASASSKAEQSNIDNAAYKNFQVKDVYGQASLLQDQEFISSVSPSMYSQLKSQYEKALENEGLTDSEVRAKNKIQASSPGATWDYNASFRNKSLNAGRSR